jgi:CPA1 family monovalent cation:H+ antiporter
MIPISPFLTLLIIAAIVGIAVKYVRLPYTIALVIAGLMIGLTSVDIGIILSPELIFLIFLPPLLFEAAICLDIGHLTRNIRTIGMLAIPGVVASTLIVGSVIHFLMGLPIEFALLFGAIISPTDPVSVVALFKELGAPKRLSTIVEGESLFNDGTGVVLFAILLLFIDPVNGPPTIFGGILEFMWVVAGGLVIGGAFGFLAYRILRPIDDHLIEVMVTVVLAFGAFLLAEEIGVSGVVAVVVAGIIVGNYVTSESMSPTTRMTLRNFWEFIAFVVNSVLFILIGVEIDIVFAGGTDFGTAAAGAIYGIAAILLARAMVVYLGLPFLRRVGDRMPRSWKHVIFWGGLRGSIPVALALILAGKAISGTEILIVMTFGVVLFSLVVGGLTMKPLMRHWGFFPEEEIRDEYESRVGEAISIEAAKKELEEMRLAGEISNSIYESLDRELDETLERASEEIAELAEKHEWLKNEQFQNARKRLLLARRIAITRARTSGVISEAAAEELVAEIDEEIEKLD